MNLTWKKDTEQFSSGEIGFRNGVKVFQFFYDACKPKYSTDNKHWKLNCLLPGIKSDLGNFESGERCKEYAERAFEFWINELNLTTK